MRSIQNINPDTIANAMSYEAYRALIQNRIDNNQSTGTNHSPSMVEYTRMNEQRMVRLDRSTKKKLPNTSEQIGTIKDPQIWLVLTEGWCGDAAQTIPIMVKIAEENSNIEIKFLLRDKNLEVMDEFLTDGSRSIPKLAILDKNTLDVLGSWGPRPAELQEIFLAEKAKPTFNYPDVLKILQLWYNKDKGVSTQSEIANLLSSIVGKQE